MDGVLDRSSPRRGSLTSLHRQSSGSFSHNTKLPSPSGTLQANNTNLYILCKDLDKFTRHFIIKSVQVIVQSRLGGNKKAKTECKPIGNDWFNINISDIAEISDKTKAALDSDGLSIKTNWRVCCEISLRTNDGGRIVLEHWIISNKTNFNSNQKLNNSQGLTRGYLANRSSTGLSSSNNNPPASNGTVPLTSINTTSTSTRIRPATISHTSRTRLNSIDDSSDETNTTSNKLLVGVNNENVDIKSSTSCFSLTSAPTAQNYDNNTRIATSPSINSLTNNNTNGIQDQSSQSTNSSSTQQQQQQSSTKSSATSSIYTIYNRMSLLLKTLTTTAHIVPAFRLASRATQSDSCQICHRVYTSPMSYHNPGGRGSVEDISYNSIPDSPNRRSLSSNSSIGSLNIRDFVSPDDIDNFCPILKLGSIRTDVNEIEVSLCYRTDMRSSNNLLRSPRSRDVYNKIFDEDCLTAAKQLLAGNGDYHEYQYRRSASKGSINQDRNSNETLNFLDQPLRPAFAELVRSEADVTQDPNFGVIESAFEGLLTNKGVQSNNDNLVEVASDAIGGPSKQNTKCNVTNGKSDRSTNAQSDPIQVPNSSDYQMKQQNLCRYPSSGSTPKSLTDSYVFVDLNPPFASEEQNDINSFFHGPSPAFSNGFDSLKDVDELTNQLAVIEANASQMDEFIDNICVSEDEEEERD